MKAYRLETVMLSYHFLPGGSAKKKQLCPISRASDAPNLDASMRLGVPINELSNLATVSRAPGMRKSFMLITVPDIPSNTCTNTIRSACTKIHAEFAII